MKISLNWIKEYAKVDSAVEQLVEKIGSQLGEVEEVVKLSEKYQGALIAKVVSCEKHPDADHLSSCLVDDGGVVKDVPRDDKGFIQVVCGADNVAASQTIIWLPPGVVVPETFGTKEPFKLEAKELRGILSNGMIASARELDFGDNHSGIVVVDEDIKPGTSLIDAFGLDDYIIDIENKMFTHRPDCFGNLGVAREISGIQGIQFASPDWYLDDNWSYKSNGQLKLTVENKLPDLVPRFMAVAMSNIVIKPSPLRLQTLLARLGVKPINNIVDITNLIMLLTGQPLHAYDYDKVKDLSDGEAQIVIRAAQKGEKINLLGGKVVEPREGAILIATSKQPIGIGGIMGGADTEVDENTKNVILECANFDMYSIRKTAFANGLFTDAVTRFSKGQSVLQNSVVIKEAVKLIVNEGGQVASDLIDSKKDLQTDAKVEVKVEAINVKLGTELEPALMQKLLQNVEFEVNEKDGNLSVKSPFWRTDIEIAEDVIEEVGRLYGFDKIPLELPKRDLQPATEDPELKLNQQVRNILSAGGANEVLRYSFVHGNLLDKVTQDKNLAYQLNNALSPDLQYYRLSLTPSLLEKVHPNIKAGNDKFALFEVGKVHIKDYLNDEQVPLETRRLGLVFANKENQAGAVFYQAKHYLNYLAQKLGLEIDFIEFPEKAELAINEQLVAPFAPRRSSLVLDKRSGLLLGVVGEFKSAVKKALKLPEYISGFEINLDQLEVSDNFVNYKPLSRYPSVEQDISLKMSKDITYGQIFSLLESAISEKATKNQYFEFSPLDIYQPADGDFKHYAFRLRITSYETTLKSAEINQLLDEAAAEANKQFSALRI